AGRAARRSGVIDTHAHLQGLEGGPDAAIEQATGAGLRRIVCVGDDPAKARAAIELAERHEGVFATAGLHPHQAAEGDAALRRDLRALADHPRVVAVGETGLDYYRQRAPHDVQARAFHGQIRLAEEARLPLVIHTREAADDTLAALRTATCPVVL